MIPKALRVVSGCSSNDLEDFPIQPLFWRLCLTSPKDTMLAFLRKWHRHQTYTSIIGGESGEEEQPMVKEENVSSVLNDEEDESSTFSSHHVRETRFQRGYSLAFVAILFGLGVILGSFIPRWISHNTIPLSFVPECIFSPTSICP